jgi:hypothetical protein
MWVISIAAFVTAYYFVNVFIPPVKRVLKILPGKRIKPFDCVQCLSVWIAIILYFLPIELSQAMAVIFGAGFLSIKIK